jgi:hypothetical protein
MVLCRSHIHSKRYQLHQTIHFNFHALLKRLLRDTLFGDGCKVGSTILLDNFKSIPPHILFYNS